MVLDMTHISLDERVASRVGRALSLVAPAVQRAFAAPVRLDGQELDAEFFFLMRTVQLEMPSSIAAFRRQQSKLARIAGGVRPASVSARDLPVDGAAGPLAARLYEPEALRGAASSPLIVFYHGGGFVFGDLDTHDASCGYLAEHSGARVLAIDYRLAPEHPFPAAVDDARAALRWAHAHAAELGVDASRIGVAGDSAGGNLSAVVAQLAARDGGPAPCCQILIYPAIDRHGHYPSLDLFARGFYLNAAAIDWFQKQYVPADHGEPDPRYNPLVTKDLSGLAPALLVTAGFDPLRDEGEAYGEALARQGNEVIVRRFRPLVHGFWNLVGTSPVCRAAAVEIAGAARVLLARKR